MKADGRFDGHVVQGHVDGIGRVREMKSLGESAEIRIEVRRRSSTATSSRRARSSVDGISLTVYGIAGRRLLGGPHPVYTGGDEPAGRDGRAASSTSRRT